jgi:hypothetical protein
VIMKKIVCLRWTGIALAFAWMTITVHLPAEAFSATASRSSINEAAMRLVQFCNDPKAGLDERAVATLVDYVLSTKKSTDHALPDSHGCPGGYQEFDTKTSFQRFIDYSFSSRVPAVVTRPSSLRFSSSLGPQAHALKLPVSWKAMPLDGSPVVLHGVQHASNTPDLTTGVYYEYDVKKVLILTNYKGRQVLLSLSKQIDRSKVGEKGFILGDDTDWNYYYSGEPGSAKSGLGWIKSYIYDYFAVSIYAETGTAPVMLRTGVFQWLSAGWSGFNFVQPHHIIEGLKRFARNNKMILESPKLPAVNQMSSVYQQLANMPVEDLRKKYAVFQQAQRLSAIQHGKISKSKAEEPLSCARASKEQMVGELMLEYLKTALGKPTAVGKHISLLAPAPAT